jgi:hypothetical protein
MLLRIGTLAEWHDKGYSVGVAYFWMTCCRQHEETYSALLHIRQVFEWTLAVLMDPRDHQWSTAGTWADTAKFGRMSIDSLKIP